MVTPHILFLINFPFRYTFKFFGLENIYILNGGLKKWKSENLPLETTPPKTEFPHSKADFFYKYKIRNPLEVTDIKRVQEASFLTKNNKGIFEILDARGEARFLGKEKEPRGMFFSIIYCLNVFFIIRGCAFW